MKQKQSIKSMLKTTFANQVHDLLEPNQGIPRSQRWRKKVQLTDAQKIEMFNKIYQLHYALSEKISEIGYEKRHKKRVQKARIERGVKPKVKTTKEQYEQMQKVAS